MNQRHSVLPVGGKARVATWGDDPDFPDVKRIVMVSSFNDFKALHDRYRHTYLVNGEPKTVKVGSWWIANPNRRQHDGGMRFMPDRDDDVVGNVLNLWQGFAVAARKPEGKSGKAGCRLFLDHGLKIICSGNEEHFDYLIKREAFIAQRRTRSEICAGLQTEIEGTGKGFWCRTMSHLYGPHAMEVQKADHVVGKHNPHLERLLKLTADEALFAQDPRHRNALYNLITEETITVEPKFVDVYKANSYLNIDVISNAAHFLPASSSARRLFVPTVSSERANDHEYFGKIADQLRSGGYEALLYHLLYEIDITDFNVRDVPKTAMLAKQAAFTRKGVDLLIETACSEGYIPRQHESKPDVSICSDYDGERGFKVQGFDYFINHHPDGELARLGALKVKRQLAKDWDFITGTAARTYAGGIQRSSIIWPPLKDLRAKFERKHGKQEWLNPDAAEWQLMPRSSLSF
jgi:hypothetical protein